MGLIQVACRQWLTIFFTKYCQDNQNKEDEIGRTSLMDRECKKKFRQETQMEKIIHLHI
jgi:hypothetical protein